MKIRPYWMSLFLVAVATEIHAFDFSFGRADAAATPADSQAPFYKPARTSDIPSVKRERQLARDPNNRQAHLEAACAYMSEGASIASKRQAAMTHVEAALIAAPKDIEALLLAGQIKILDGKPDLAVGYYQSAVAADAKDPRAQLGLGDALNRLGDSAGADMAFQKYRELNASASSQVN